MAKKKEKMKFISKRGNSYVVLVKWTDAGKPQQKSVGSFSARKFGSDSLALEAAISARDKAVSDLKNHRISSKTLTVQALFDQVQARAASKNTERNNQWLFSAMIPDQLKKKRIEQVTLQDVQSTVDAFARSHSQDAVNRTPFLWKKIFRQANMNGIYVPNLGELIEKPKSKIPVKTRDKLVSSRNLEIFYETLISYNDWAEINAAIYTMMRVMEYCGLRPQEGMALMREDIDLNDWVLRVRRSVGTTKTETRQLIPLKTAESRRDLPIPPALRPILAERCAEIPSGLLFAGLDGKPFDIRWLSDYIRRVSIRAGVRVNLYRLRHNFANDLIRTANPKTVQGMMGHSAINTTFGYAGGPTLNEMSDALAHRILN